MSPGHGWCVLDNFFSSQRPLFSLSARIWNPPVNVSETPDRFFIRMEIAGVKPNDLFVTTEQSLLIVRGRRQDRPHTPQENYHVMEIHFGCFERVFRLPSNVDEEGIVASYQDGFLNIEIPKGSGSGRSIAIVVREK